MPKCVNFPSRAVYKAQRGVRQFCCPSLKVYALQKKKEKRSIIFYRSSPVALTRERHTSISESTCRPSRLRRRRFLFLCSQRRPLQAERVTSQRKLTSSDLTKGGKKTLSSRISRAARLAAPPTAIATCVEAKVWSRAFSDQQLHRFHTPPRGSGLRSRRGPRHPARARRIPAQTQKEICRLSFTQPRTLLKAHRNAAEGRSRLSGGSRRSSGVQAQTRAEEAEFERGGSPQGLSSPCSS